MNNSSASAASNAGATAGSSSTNNKKSTLPPLQRLTPAEASAVASMFKIYDYKSSGLIPNNLAINLVRSLGFDTEREGVEFSKEVTLNEVLFMLDTIMPNPDPMLLSSLVSFKGLVAKPINEFEPHSRYLTPQDISDHMESLGRPPAAAREAKLLLMSMLEYDDCAVDPVLRSELFNKQIVSYAKKTNALRDFR